MAAATSLGLHKPAALPYLIDEGILPPDPSTDSYTWRVELNNGDGIIEEDELVITETCVVWSRGSVVRKCFRFEIEEEPVTQAVLTNFFPEKREKRRRPLDAQGNGANGLSENKDNTERSSANASTKALVVFLRTLAHVYFLSGTSHVIHLPFEVEHAIAAPSGLIIQRRLRTEKIPTTSIKIPVVPPNSFISSQIQPWSASSSQQSTFSIASLGAPKQLPLPPTSELGHLWQTPPVKDDSNWPRLFSLTDPLAEMGLIVTTSKNGGSRRSFSKAFTMDPAEELVHVSRRDEFTAFLCDAEQPLILAVTLNRQTSIYTVWRLTYMSQEEASRSRNGRAGGAIPRRRSSFAPTTGTGATTPNTGHKYPFRESLGDTGQSNYQRLLNRRNGDIAEEKLDFASALDPDFETSGLPRRKSRRVSSMLARSDLSASHERSVFTDFAIGQQPGRRGESLGSQHARNSFGYHATTNGPLHLPQSQFTNSVQSFLEAPVDDLLEELRAGGDFEGFHNMGLEDDEFESLRKEIVFTKIESIPAEHGNVRYSSQHLSAQSQCRVFTVSAPICAADDPSKNDIVICILDVPEKKLLLITIHTKLHLKMDQVGHNVKKIDESSQNTITVSWGGVLRAKRVLDACKVSDGEVSRILILTETFDGYGELTLQAPWSQLMNVTLPSKLIMNNTRSLGHDAAPQKRREGGFKRVLNQGPAALRGLRNPLSRGMVDICDDEGRLHQLQLLMAPKTPIVKQVLDVCRNALPGSRGGETILKGWWEVYHWMVGRTGHQSETEWDALVVILFVLVFGISDMGPTPTTPKSHRRSRSNLLRSSSGAQADIGKLQEMFHAESELGRPQPSWMGNGGWEWICDKNDQASDRETKTSFKIVDGNGMDEVKRLLTATREFMNSPSGRLASAMSGYLPTAAGKNIETRHAAITDIIVGLHLLHEEKKLDITSVESPEANTIGLTFIMLQICTWIGWTEWAKVYRNEDFSIDGMYLDTSRIPIISQPFDPPLISDWILERLITQRYVPFLTLAEILRSRSELGDRILLEKFTSSFMPRTALFMKFFSSLAPDFSSIQIVEALRAAGVTAQLMDTLPEGVLVILKESIVNCQSHPPVSWAKEMLELVDRVDVNTLLQTQKRRRIAYSSLLAPTHETNNDIQSVCMSNSEPESVGSFDGTAEVDRQAITRLIFKDDRRFNEAAKILNTSKPTIARCEAEPEWSESDLLEAQKGHVQMLAFRTLAIPTGRGLLYFSARIPLLTEKFPIGGFNLHCVMKPTNNTVGVDKNAFTEEKVCWAFFHAGVSAGLSISRDAKGIDTSWILYNKPQELSNRHAGFLLALGLNGHLKSVAKWVSFKYLTPKHTMTSIGLLLGLAASYLGTMDSLITRLLSVHVTRMLPPGAAELNLSPLTQTTGIMGIGLLYCNTQHRRMSEIMLSEIEQTDPEEDDEPLRNEGYRLAAGFALGFINLGKGSDLKGLHDMRLTERLLRLAVGSKKVDLVHVLDKATAAAVVAVTLIFMKTEDQVVSRKIDVPTSILQYDYVRPDVFLLRTLAKHLIMWSKIEASSSWIEASLPSFYRARSKLINIHSLSSEDLPFYNILTGLCFSIALRFAGSGSSHVRDLLVHYLEQLMRICKFSPSNYDQKLVRNTVRNCQDLLALSTATVMAGSGDLVVFRRLRAMHGRDGGDTPYGSHLVAHLAIGALFLGGGTHTFGTSNLAIASLIVAFYPIFPVTILDNKSHLQAFRHFWVLATESRCLVARDIDTSRPVSIPVSITLRSGRQFQLHSPCLLPDLQSVISVVTTSREYWNVVLDFRGNPKHLDAFKATQTMFVRRRPAYDASTAIFHSTLQALDDTDGVSQKPLEWLLDLSIFSTLTTAERALVLPPETLGASSSHAGTEGTLVDTRLILERATLTIGKRDRLQGLKLLFEWANRQQNEGRDLQWIRLEVIDRLKAAVWMMGREGEADG